MGGRMDALVGGWLDDRRKGGRSDRVRVAVTDIKIFLRRGDSGDPGNDRAR